MIDVLLTIFWGVVLLSIIVVIHEGGHFLAARMFKVRVLEFMLGLPGPSVGFRRKGGQTRVGVTAIPLGGYARIAGMDVWADESTFPRAAALVYRYGEIHSKDLEAASAALGFDVDESLAALVEWGTVERVKIDHDSFKYVTPQTAEFEAGTPRPLNDPAAFIASEKTHTYTSIGWFKRVVICAGGPIANLLTAIIVISLVLCLHGTNVASTTISAVAEDSPAQAAGMLAGDTIVSVDGLAVDSWEEFYAAMEDVQDGQTLTIGYVRDGVETEVQMQAQMSEETGRAIIGVTAGVENIKYSIEEALGISMSYIAQVAMAVVSLFNPATALDTVSQSSSIIGVSVVAREAAEVGFVSFAWLAGMLSVSIGLMNLLPLMPLDGGRIVVETIQKLRGKLLSQRAISVYSSLGMAAFLLLFVVVMGQDIINLAFGTFPI